MNEEMVNAIKTFNIGSTGKKSDRENLDYNNRTLHIYHKENVNIGSIIGIFINQYTDFKKEYDNIQKLNSYNELRYVGFYKEDEEKSLCLDFYDNNTTMNSKYGYLLLTLKEKNGVCSCYVSNDHIGKDYDIREEKIDEKVVKSYIALFEKHKDLLDAYNFLQSKFVFGNGFNVMNTRINGDILNELKSMEINFGNCYMNRSDYVSLEVELLNEHRFLKEEIIIDDKTVEPTSEIVTYLLNEVYLNREYLPSLYKYNNYCLTEKQKLNDEITAILKKYCSSIKFNEENPKDVNSSLKKKKCDVLAVPCNRPFIVSKEKAGEFKNQTNSKKDNDFVRKMAETFKKNNLVDDGPVLKKTKKTDKK